jgi:hypothetical protein
LPPRHLVPAEQHLDVQVGQVLLQLRRRQVDRGAPLAILGRRPVELQRRAREQQLAHLAVAAARRQVQCRLLLRGRRARQNVDGAAAPFGELRRMLGAAAAPQQLALHLLALPVLEQHLGQLDVARRRRREQQRAALGRARRHARRRLALGRACREERTRELAREGALAQPPSVRDPRGGRPQAGGGSILQVERGKAAVVQQLARRLVAPLALRRRRAVAHRLLRRDA